MIKWYVIPLLAIVCYIYTREIKEARRNSDWNAVLAGLTIFGVDFFKRNLERLGYVSDSALRFLDNPGRHSSANTGGLEY